MHLEHKPGETMQVDWAGQTAALVDTDTGEKLDAYLFVAETGRPLFHSAGSP